MGLLFLLVFGALLLISAVALLRSLRERGEESRDRHERFKRELRALWIGASVFWLAEVPAAGERPDIGVADVGHLGEALGQEGGRRFGRPSVHPGE
ncbi:MAG: hypothetical protein AB7O64_15425, partial [Methylibium sp.]